MGGDKCACGRPLHYGDPQIQQMVEEFIRVLGETIRVTVEGRTWLVQRHYIALHGLKAQDLLHDKLPFLEVTPDASTTDHRAH